MTDLRDNKAGSGVVDPDDFNAVVDAVKVLQAGGGGGGSQTLAQTLALGNDADGLAIRNLPDPGFNQDADTMAARDAAILAAIPPTPGLAAVLAAGFDGGGGGMTNTGSIAAGALADISAQSLSLGDASFGATTGLKTWGGDIDSRGGNFSTMGGSGTGTARIKGAIGANGVTPNTPELPAIPTPQDITDALVALGFCTQAS